MTERVLFSPRIFRVPTSLPDVSLLEGVVASEIRSAMTTASAQLARHRIRHALVGALAVGAWGYPRASKDVDFLVGDEAFERHAGGIVTLAAGVPIGIGSVPVDHLGIMPEERHLEVAVSRPLASGDLPIAPLDALIYLKLKSPRRRDDADVVELLRVNDPRPIRRYLETNAPGLVAKFDALVAEALE